jgi:predicted TIM-barrel fold metal-dependent hydrolase
VHPSISKSFDRQREALERILHEAHSYGVDKVVLSGLTDLGPSVTPDDVREGNDYVLRFIAERPEETIGLCYTSPLHGDEAIREIDRCIGAGMRGIKLLTACAMSDERVDPIAARAAELRAPILQHAWYKRDGQTPDESTPADVAALAARHPKTMIVMAHLTGCNERGMADIAPHANVHVDTSGSEPEAGITEMAVRKLGARRVLFGTDASGRGYAAALGKVLGAKISARDKALILGGNAARLLQGRLTK